MPSEKYTDNQGLSEAWTKFWENVVIDHGIVILLFILSCFAIRGLTSPNHENKKFKWIASGVIALGWVIFVLNKASLNINAPDIGTPDMKLQLIPAIIGLVLLVALSVIGYKAFRPRKWFATFTQSVPAITPKVYWPSWVSFSMIALGILTAALLHFWWTYLTAVVLIAAGYWLSLHINIPVRQVFMLTWFGKPLYPVFAKGASNLQRRDTKGSGWIPKPEANSDDHNKVLAVGLKRLRWIPNWLGPLDFVPLAWAKPENKTETDWLECMAIPETDDNGDEEAVAAGPSFKLNFREAHRLSLDHVDIFWGLADDERNRIDEYIIGVINDWLADYMHTQTPDMILDADFLKEMTSTKIDNLRRLRNRTDAAKDTVLRLAHEERQVKLRDIQRDLNDLRGYVLESTGHELLEIGMLRRVPDEIYKAQLDEYASKRAEEKTALRDINVQTAKGQAFVARLTSITEVLNVSLAAMNKPLVTEGEVWDQIIEDQRSRRAASHYLGGAKLGGLLSKLIPKK